MLFLCKEKSSYKILFSYRVISTEAQHYSGNSDIKTVQQGPLHIDKMVFLCKNSDPCGNSDPSMKRILICEGATTL